MSRLRQFLRTHAPHFLRGLRDDYFEMRRAPVYGTWDEAAAAAHSDYENDKLARFRVARAKANPAIDVRCNVLHLCVALLGDDISITDFGGAVGYHGDALLRAFPDVSYTVVETPAVVSRSSELNPKLRFQITIPESCDVFFSSCALPYLPDPYAILEKGFSSARKLVLLARNCFSDREFFRVQESKLSSNGAGTFPPGFEDVNVRYAIRTINPEDIIRFGEERGFRLAARLFDPDDKTGFVRYRYKVWGGTLAFVRR